DTRPPSALPEANATDCSLDVAARCTGPVVASHVEVLETGHPRAGRGGDRRPVPGHLEVDDAPMLVITRREVAQPAPDPGPVRLQQCFLAGPDGVEVRRAVLPRQRLVGPELFGGHEAPRDPVAPSEIP